MEETNVKVEGQNTNQQAVAPNNAPEPSPSDNKPTDAEAKLLKEVMAKKAKIEEQGKKIEELQKISDSIKELGGLDSLKQIVEAKKEADKKALEAKGEWDKLKAQMVSEHQKATEDLRKQVSDLESKIKLKENRISELTVGSAFANSDYLKNRTILTPAKARIIYGDYFDIAEDGSVRAYDKPRGKDGRTVLVDQTGNPVGFETAIERIIASDPEKDSLLRASSKQGSGSGTTGGNSDAKPIGNIKLSAIDMISAGLAKLK